MAKTWGGQSFNEDFEPIDAMGNKLGEKDWQANRDWNAQNDPGQINNFSPAVLAQTGGIKPAPGAGGIGMVPGGGQDQFSWDNPGDFAPSAPVVTGGIKPGRDVESNQFGFQQGTGGGRQNAPGQQAVDANGVPLAASPASGGALSMQTPDLDAAALMSQLQGPAALGQLQGPQGLGQVSGPANLGHVSGPAALGQVQGPANLGQVQGPQALGQLGAAPTVAQAGPASAFGQSVQGSIQRGLADPTVDTNSPAFQGQVAAFQRNAQRTAERTRAAAAQRANAQGTLGSGGFDAGVNRILQNQGADEQAFESQLMQSELNAGRDRQARAQQLGAGLFSQEQQQGLTERLANQGAQLTGMGLNNQRDLANQGTQMQTLGLNSNRDLANLGAQLQTQGTNTTRDLSNQSSALQMAGINSGREQSNQAAGLQMAGLNSGRDVMNQQALLQMLGLNSGRDVQNQQTQMQTMGLNSNRDLANAGAQNQRNLALFGGKLQTGLANQGAQMTQRGYNLQKYLGDRDLGLRDKQIGNQQTQFYDQLGQQLGLSTAQLNQEALLSLLRG